MYQESTSDELQKNGEWNNAVLVFLNNGFATNQQRHCLHFQKGIRGP